MEGNTLKQLEFEDYLKLYHKLSAENLTFAHPNQAKILDAVKFLLKSPPVRSTIRTNIVPLVFLCTASLSLEEIREDLQTIGWEEFTVPSVVTVETAVPAMSCSSTGSEPVTEKNGRKEMAKKVYQSIPYILLICEQATVGNTEREEVTREFNRSRRLPEHRTIRVSAKSAKNDDKYSWQKYDSRKRVNHPYRQQYYSRETGCHAKKVIDRDANDSSMLIITYAGHHNYLSP